MACPPLDRASMSPKRACCSSTTRTGTPPGRTAKPRAHPGHWSREPARHGSGAWHAGQRSRLRTRARSASRSSGLIPSSEAASVYPTLPAGQRGAVAPCPQSANGEDRSSPFGIVDWPIEPSADVGALSLERLEVQAPREQVSLEVGRHLGRLLGNDLLGQANVPVVFHPCAGGDQPAHDDVLLEPAQVVDLAA